jgi:magnesium chelatase family protein
MALAQVLSRAGVGVTAPEVTVEVHVSGGLPKVSMVGLPATAVRESKDRVRAALYNSSFHFPPAHLTVSLAPADLPKEGGRFDLPIALGILAASGQVTSTALTQFEFLGELSLSGRLNGVGGVLPAAIAAKTAGRGLVVPTADGPEAALAGSSRQFTADSLSEVVAWLLGRGDLDTALLKDCETPIRHEDLADVHGQHRARRALEIAAAGGHNLLFSGPPGTGKTMLAARLPGILPPLSEQEALEAAAVASVSGPGLDVSRWKTRPFRAPHHSASSIALVGGGSRPRPGEISLAHHGVLFLDELPEFRRDVLEMLREPMESGRIMICRAASRAEFPARFQLVVAMNPCPCGSFGDRQKPCTCSAEQVGRYRARVSGPLLDRIDIFAEVARPKQIVIPGRGRPGEPSSDVRERVVAAHRVQIERQGVCNGRLGTPGVIRHCRLTTENQHFLESAAERLTLSPRGCQRVLKVARTTADLEGCTRIRQSHLAEAIGYRQPRQP